MKVNYWQGQLKNVLWNCRISCWVLVNLLTNFLFDKRNRRAMKGDLCCVVSTTFLSKHKLLHKNIMGYSKFWTTLVFVITKRYWINNTRIFCCKLAIPCHILATNFHFLFLEDTCKNHAVINESRFSFYACCRSVLTSISVTLTRSFLADKISCNL